MPPAKQADFEAGVVEALERLERETAGSPGSARVLTTNIWSAGKPSAARSRVAATSACTSGLASPYFTRIVSPSGSSQSNFGDVPPTFFGRNRQVTSASVSKPPGPGDCRPGSRVRTGTAGGRQTRADRSASSRRRAAPSLSASLHPGVGFSLCRRRHRAGRPHALSDSAAASTSEHELAVAVPHHGDRRVSGGPAQQEPEAHQVQRDGQHGDVAGDRGVTRGSRARRG